MSRLFLSLFLLSSLAFAKTNARQLAHLKSKDFRYQNTTYSQGVRVASNQPMPVSQPVLRSSVPRSYRYNQPDSRLGLLLGLNFAYGAANPSQSGRTRNGFGVSGFWQRRLSDTFSLQPELHYAPRGVQTNLWSFSGVDISGEVTLDYLELPLLLRTNVIHASTTSPGVFLIAGPSMAIALNRSVEVMGLMTLDLASRFRQLDFLLHFGLGVEYPLSQSFNLISNLRYALGVTDIDATDASYFTRHIQMSAGISWSW